MTRRKPIARTWILSVFTYGHSGWSHTKDKAMMVFSPALAMAVACSRRGPEALT